MLGLPGVAFDYGLLLATAAVLDDGNAAAVEDRRAHGFPSGRTVRARLLLAGPGRQDLTGEFGLDVTVPGYHSARYPGTARVRQGTRGIVNPISVPTILAAPGLALENWSGSEDADAPWLERLLALGGAAPLRRPTADRAERAFGAALALRSAQPRDAGAAAGFVPRAALGRRDLRHATLSERRRSARSPGCTRRRRSRPCSPQRLRAGRPATRRRSRAGARIFSERVVGAIANRQILKLAPARLRRSQAGGAGPGADRSDQAARGAAGRPLRRLPRRRRRWKTSCRSAANPPPLGRCTHCHLAHSRVDRVGRRPGRGHVDRRRGWSPSPRSRSARGRRPPRSPSAQGCHSSTATSVRSSIRRAGSSRSTPTATATPSGTRPPTPARAGSAPSPAGLRRRPRPQWPFAVELPVIADPTTAPAASPGPASASAGCAPRRSPASSRPRPTCTTDRCRRCARCSSRRRGARQTSRSARRASSSTPACPATATRRPRVRHRAHRR